MSLFLDRYDGAAMIRMFEDAGVLDALRDKEFGGFGVSIESGPGLQRVALHADKAGARHLLLEACLRRVAVAAQIAAEGGALADARLDLLLVHWLREQDPTASFAPGRPALLLQSHPGLGVLRRAFRVVVRVAGDLGVDGVASQPKFFHDAIIFHRSRLFLFLDGAEQGRFEALARDLGTLRLCDASVAVAGWCARDQTGRVMRWQPGFQVFPLSARLTAHFHSPTYATAVAAARDVDRFQVDAEALAAARVQLGLGAPPATSAVAARAG